MYWLGPAPYLRWVAAGVVLVVGLYAEFRPSTTISHPFAATDVQRGDPITSVEWRSVPAGLLPMPELSSGAYAATAISSGEPLLPSHLSGSPQAPQGWWSIPVPMPFVAPVGSAVQLVDSTSGRTTDGVVVAIPPDDPFALDPVALVAVAPAEAATFAVAAATRTVSVLIAG